MATCPDTCHRPVRATIDHKINMALPEIMWVMSSPSGRGIPLRACSPRCCNERPPRSGSPHPPCRGGSPIHPCLMRQPRTVGPRSGRITRCIQRSNGSPALHPPRPGTNKSSVRGARAQRAALPPRPSFLYARRARTKGSLATLYLNQTFSFRFRCLSTLETLLDSLPEWPFR